jgi:hypothetical protein
MLLLQRKKFEIRALNWPASGEKLTYYTSSDEKSKHLLFLCRVTHQFSMAIQPRLSEVRRREEEGSLKQLIVMYRTVLEIFRVFTIKS